MVDFLVLLLVELLGLFGGGHCEVLNSNTGMEFPARKNRQRLKIVVESG